MTLVSRAMKAARALPSALGIAGRPAGLVLVYHRIAALDSDPQRLAVPPQRFAQHLEILRTHCHPMPLGELIARARRGRLPERAVAVTADDGYADNFETARPLLDRYEIAATIFIATSYLGSGREFWWDDLERLLLTPGQLPETLQLRIAGTTHEWNLSSASTYGAEESRRHAAWNVERPEDPTPRHHLYRRLCERLRTLPSEERDASLRDLANAAAGVAGPRATHRILTADEVVGLARSGLVEIGAHTASHPRLSALPLATQRHEIIGSRRRLGEVTGLEVTSFAYPFGTRSDYTLDTTALVRDAGFALGCSVRRGLVGPRCDPFQVPRVVVRDWSAEVFAGRLREWLGHQAVTAA